MAEEEPSRAAEMTSEAEGGAAAEEEEEEEEEAGVLSEAESLLASLYETHDFFFSPKAGEKHQLLQEQAEKVLRELSRVEEGGGCTSSAEKGRCAYIRGRTLDAFSEFSPEAEFHLSRAVKLCPGDLDTWNALGHCFWKKRDIAAAHKCFQEALSRRRNAASLRHLSMLLRQMPDSGPKALDESIVLAKEATLMGLHDADSWYVLGNAHVAKFFGGTHALDDLDKAMRAYRRAEGCGGQDNPDLWYNRAEVLRYQQQYVEASEGYRMAMELDPQLPAADAVADMERSVHRLADLVARKGKVKVKRLMALTAPLGQVAAPHGYTMSTLSELSGGDNRGVAVAVRVLVPLGSSQVPEQFVVADSTGECVALSLYQTDSKRCQELSAGGRDGAVLVVCQPHIVQITAGKVDESYRCLRVGDPSSVLIGGEPLGRSNFSLRISHFDV
jgi:tetratricopeptide (TPR) repeat protein